MRSLLAGMLALAAASILVIVPANAGASTIHVTTNADSGAGCTLRNAITAANTNAASGACAAGQAAPVVDTIDFVGLDGQSIALGSTLPSLSSLLAIAGPGASQLTISGNNLVQPLQVVGGTITISGLTIADGYCGAGCNLEGGAIFQSAGDLTLDSVSLTSNTAEAVVAAASNFAEGGAIEVTTGSVLHVVNSTISGNTVSAISGSAQNGASGGAIMNRGTTTIDRSTLAGNQVTTTASGAATSNAQGGAIDSDGHLTISRSTLSGNSVSASGSMASASGGAIAEFNAPMLVTLSIDRSTIANNTVSSTVPNSTQSGGVQIASGPAAITSSTISGNSAKNGANIGNSSAVTLKNSIISNPLVGANCSAAVTSAGFNIESANSCVFNQASDRHDLNPMLATTLADNGGPTQTLALLPTSPAIDKGKASAGETVDQRGFVRPDDAPTIANAAGGDGSDIGAYERDQVSPDTTIDSGPDDGSTVTDAVPTFAFSSSESGSTFECAVDGAAFSSCSSPDPLSGLADGAHTFAVRAIDATQNVDPTPASRSFTVATTPPPPGADKTPPETTITKEPKAKSAKAKAKYKFTSSESGSTFECAFDSKKFKPCNAGKVKYKHLDLGKHKFSVRATDAAGNVDASPANDKFKRKRA